LTIRTASIGCLAAAASLCVAASPLLAAAFGNTIVSTYPDGRTAEIWLRSDGGYSSEGRTHLISSGRWNLRGDDICFHQTHPWLPFATFCTPMPSATVGATWRSRAPTGETTVLRLVRGHVTGQELNRPA
jgi:hypothetical protein